MVKGRRCTIVCWILLLILSDGVQCLSLSNEIQVQQRCEIEQDVPKYTLIPGQPVKISASTVNTTSYSVRFSYPAEPNLFPHIQAVGEQDENAEVALLISQPCGTSVFSLPTRLRAGCFINHFGAVLCPEIECDISAVGTFQLTVTSLDVVSADIIVELRDIGMSFGKVTSFNTTATEPAFVRFEFPPNVDHVIFSANSLSDTELIISIQNSSCPIFDLPQNVMFSGIHQSMKHEATLHLHRDDLGPSVVIVAVVKTDISDTCQDLASDISLTVVEAQSQNTYILPILFLIILFFIVPYLVFMLYLTVFKRWGYKEPEVSMNIQEGSDQRQSSSEAKPLLAERGQVSSYQTSQPTTAQTSATDYDDENDDDSVGDRTYHRSGSIITIASRDDGWLDGSEDAKSVMQAYRTRHPLKASDLARKLPSRQDKKFWNYCTVELAILVFYFLPVFQFVYNYLKEFNQGQQDSCYYNFRCARPYWRFYSFNSILSNLGYVTLGVLFMLIVRHRDKSYRFTQIGQQIPSTPDDVIGLPRHYGVFYAVGLAIVGEGIFSACYHICPTPVNFQFDTSFMYTMSGLMLMALYQRRHSDAQANAHVMFIGLASVVFVVVIGVYWASLSFYIALLLIGLPLTYLAVVQIYFIGFWSCSASRPSCRITCIHPEEDYVRGDIDCVARWYTLGLKITGFPRRKSRAVLLTIISFVTVLFFIIGIATQPDDVPTHFLGLFIIDLLIYCTYYVIMKFIHKERPTITCIISFVLMLACSVPAVYFFEDHAANWALSPADSRGLNTDCQLLDFFDYHDVWHLLSAYGLFFCSFFMLSLDDDLVKNGIPCKVIPVF